VRRAAFFIYRFTVLYARPNISRWLRAATALALACSAFAALALDYSSVADARSVEKTTSKAQPDNARKEAPLRLAPMSRAEILASDPTRLERVGRHVVVGYHSYAEVKALVEKKAIAGIFITDHNVKRRKRQDIRSDIDALQSLRKEQGMPPLLIAADQEGGSVSRLTPPLKKQPTLARLLAPLKNDDARRAAVEQYAADQAAELKALGVTLNFSPVVDLNLKASKRSDGETRLRTRAIAADPYFVSKVAGWYCDGLAKANVMCTLKHFPGLGRVNRDTHVAMGDISASERELELNDWYPFRQLMDRPNVVTMLGHVRVAAIDAKTPASFSQTIIKSLIRDRWNHAGLLITDDFSMGAVTRSADGVGGAAVKALNAGVDLLLVSYLAKHYNSVMSALLRADQDGLLETSNAAESRERIGRALNPPNSDAR
jgi:beta-N-acetylhexosaminidase